MTYDDEHRAVSLAAAIARRDLDAHELLIAPYAAGEAPWENLARAAVRQLAGTMRYAAETAEAEELTAPGSALGEFEAALHAIVLDDEAAEALST